MSPDVTAALLAKVPFFRFLGFAIVEADEVQVTARMPFAERFIGNPVMDYYHGGIVASVMEAVASLTVWEDPEKRGPKPINLMVDYLRPARPETLHVRAAISRKGRRMASVETVSWQAEPERPVAKGLFHFLLV